MKAPILFKLHCVNHKPGSALPGSDVEELLTQPHSDSDPILPIQCDRTSGTWESSHSTGEEIWSTLVKSPLLVQSQVRGRQMVKLTGNVGLPLWAQEIRASQREWQKRIGQMYWRSSSFLICRMKIKKIYLTYSKMTFNTSKKLEKK